MKLGFYHYFFRERRKKNAPRVLHDIRPIVKAYLNFEGKEWKKEFTTEDGEHLLVLKTESPSVHMIVGTRKQDLIQAVNWKKMTCEDLTARLQADEDAGFAGYFSLNDRMLGMASTLRGPKTAAVGRLINHLAEALGAGKWAFELTPIGTSVTLEEAKELKFVSRTAIRVRKGSSIFHKLAEFGAADEDALRSIEVIFRARPQSNIHEVVAAVANKENRDSIERMTVRARAMLDDELSDYFVSAEGNISEALETGLTQKQLVTSIAHHFAQNQLARERLAATIEAELYSKDLDVQTLSRLGDSAHWDAALLG